MDTALVQLILASISYAVGGLFMKLSAGLTRPLPSVGVFALFVIGATLQTMGMRRADLGVAYIMVLGMEALAAVALSIFFLNESWSLSRLGAVTMVVAGIYWLRIA